MISLKQAEAGDQEFQTFSFDFRLQASVSRTLLFNSYNPKTHQIILNNLENSAMYSGAVLGTGPRYCPQ